MFHPARSCARVFPFVLTLIAAAACSGGGASTSLGGRPPIAAVNGTPVPAPSPTLSTEKRAHPSPSPSASVVPSPSASVAPSPSAAPSAAAAPTAAPIAVSYSDTTYASITNGQPWPATYRPYSAHPWNTALTNPTSVDSANTNAASTYWNDAVDHIAASSGNDFSHPVYVATANDPTITVNCGAAMYGCSADGSGSVSSFASFHVPAKARPSISSDAHFAVVQPDGTEYDFWEAKQPSGDWSNGMVLSAGIGIQTSILGSGVPTYASATSGAALAGGLIRFDELARGVIPHAIFLDFPCTQSHRYPGTSDGYSCASGGIPMGAHVFLTMSDSAIDALPASTIAPTLRPILHALHQYGGYALDTYGGNNTGAPFWEYESYTQYSAYGQAYPGDAFAITNGYSAYYNPTYKEWAGGPIRWSQLAPYLEVLQPCYAQGTC